MRLLLASLSVQAREWRHGYDLMKETGLLSGTLYPLLMRMTDNGLVEAEWREPAQPGRPARHVYRLTADGLALALALEDGGPLPAGTKASLA
ncbi:MAG: PadR family transcriptional regulator [Sphingomonadales bacterium]|nr:MAG: PadR family transcriptional regulator [Sphingomonadales bacterium]